MSRGDYDGGAWIPGHVLYSPVSAQAKILHGRIEALSRRDGFCYASNAFFEKDLGADERTIRRWLAELWHAGFIDGIGKGKARKLFPTRPNMSGLNLNPVKSDREPGQLRPRTRTTSSAPIRKSKEREKERENGDSLLQIEGFDTTPVLSTAESIFEYWATKRHAALGRNGAGPRQKATPKRLGKIQARLDDGYSIADLRKAIDGVLASEFHLTHGYTDIELICRDQAYVEKYMALATERANEPEVGSVEWAEREAAGIDGRAE